MPMSRVFPPDKIIANCSAFIASHQGISGLRFSIFLYIIDIKAGLIGVKATEVPGENTIKCCVSSSIIFPHCACQIKKIYIACRFLFKPMSHVTKAYVACNYTFKPMSHFTKAYAALSN